MSEQRDQPPESEPCGACRGTGVVVSHLGGEPHELACPWCEGTGVRLRGHDAQAHWRGEQAERS